MTAALPPPLFSAGDAENPAYRNLRDEVDSPANQGRSDLKELGRIPDQKIIMRYTTAIAEKHRKLTAYRQGGIIADADAYVIAVNSYALSHCWAEPEVPRVLKAVFPIGALEFIFDRKTMQDLGTRHQFRPNVIKASGAPVSTEIFVNANYTGISAVLHSYANACTHGPLGVDFILIHNPMAAQALPRSLFLDCREYVATPVGDGYELACHLPVTAGNKDQQ